MDNKFFILFLVFVSVAVFLSINVIAAPNGANVDPIANSTANSSDPESLSAFAGNVTEVDIDGKSTTQAWQGYYGNVTGAIQLADSSSHVMYNWSFLSPRGEVYASTNGTLSWVKVQCFNFTAAGNYSDDSMNNGSTSMYGMNMSQLESEYNIGSNDVDGINETFSLQNHAEFYTNSLQFSANECRNTKVFDSQGSGLFDEVLLYSPDSASVIYASLLRDNGNGFDSATHDFEMLVPEDGHGENTGTTPYYFYLELG